jgi:hypothetical protein
MAAIRIFKAVVKICWVMSRESCNMRSVLVYCPIGMFPVKSWTGMGLDGITQDSIRLGIKRGLTNVQVR